MTAWEGELNLYSKWKKYNCFFPASFDYEYEAPAGPGYHQPQVCGPWPPHHHEVAMFTPEVTRYAGHDGGFYHQVPTYDYFNNNEHQCE